ncbi:MAG: hypothetical protein JNK81_12725, partial [Anaerolineales bacterium]|nr:hypothetical protein [Anaerolineales bacterium]
LRPQKISEQSNPSFVGRRQEHIHFKAQTVLEFKPQNEHECAGLVLLQNNKFNFEFVITKNVIRLIKRTDGIEEILAEKPINNGLIYLKVEAHEQDYSFYFSNQLDSWQVLSERQDGRILSTPVAGGFVGTWIGMYASSNGQTSSNYADFDWFDYIGLDES